MKKNADVHISARMIIASFMAVTIFTRSSAVTRWGWLRTFFRYFSSFFATYLWKSDARFVPAQCLYSTKLCEWVVTVKKTQNTGPSTGFSTSCCHPPPHQCNDCPFIYADFSTQVHDRIKIHDRIKTTNTLRIYTSGSLYQSCGGVWSLCADWTCD